MLVYLETNIRLISCSYLSTLKELNSRNTNEKIFMLQAPSGTKELAMVQSAEQWTQSTRQILKTGRIAKPPVALRTIQILGFILVMKQNQFQRQLRILDSRAIGGTVQMKLCSEIISGSFTKLYPAVHYLKIVLNFRIHFKEQSISDINQLEIIDFTCEPFNNKVYLRGVFRGQYIIQVRINVSIDYNFLKYLNGQLFLNSPFLTVEALLYAF